MENNTKETKLYLLLQIILVLLVVMVFVYIFTLVNNSNKDKYNTNEEIETKSEKLETNKNTENQENNAQTIPLVTENETSTTSSQTTNNKYFYNQLNDNAKIIYDEIEKNIENLKSGQYTIDLPDTVSSILKEDGGEEELNVNFQSAWDAIGLDRVDLFFVDISKVNMVINKKTFIKSTSYKLSMQPKEGAGYLLDNISNGDTVNSMLSQIKKQKDEIVKTLVGNDYDKIVKAHNWLIDNVEYDTTLSGENIYNIYGALISGKAVCEGYAEAFKYLMDAVGIPCVLVVGQATNSAGNTESHEWNYVKLNNKWYAIDCTWDDPLITGNGNVTREIRYKYFLKGETSISKNHFANGQITNQGKEFSYPELATEDYVNGLF